MARMTANRMTGVMSGLDERQVACPEKICRQETGDRWHAMIVQGDRCHAKRRKVKNVKNAKMQKTRKTERQKGRKAERKISSKARKIGK